MKATLIGLLVIVISLMPIVISQAQEEIVPAFNVADCPMGLPETLVAGDDIVCGYLTVLENRDEPDGRTLDLAVAIIKARGDNPQDDPLVFLTGGPEQGALGYEDYWATYPTVENRDFILIDPRGTGFSEPDMDCSSIDYPLSAIVERAPTAIETREADLRWASACRDLLLSRNIDLSMYNTASWSADIEDLRLALNLDAINLYGVSFGAYWALAIARDYPDGIRSITLDSVSPQPIDTIAETGLRLDNAFKMIFAHCASDAACSETFPTFAADFNYFITRLIEQPVLLPTSEVSWMTNGSFVNSAFTALYDPNLIPILPIASNQIAAEDNWEVAIQLGEDIGNFGITEAINNLVICHDEVAFTDRAAFISSIEAYPQYAEYLDGINNFFDVCDIWNVGLPDPIGAEPIVSDVPSLILTGSFDPVTPPRYAHIAAETLSNSYVFEFAGLAHAVTFYDACPRMIMTEFVDNPTSEPDSACMATMPPMTYLTDVTVNPAVFQFAKNLFLETNYVIAGLITASALAFLLAALGYPLYGWRNRKQEQSRLIWGHAILIWLTALVYLIFTVALVALIINTAQNSEATLLFGLPANAAPIFTLFWMALALLIITIGLTIWLWISQKRVFISHVVFISLSVILTVLLWSWGIVN